MERVLPGTIKGSTWNQKGFSYGDSQRTLLEAFFFKIVRLEDPVEGCITATWSGWWGEDREEAERGLVYCPRDSCCGSQQAERWETTGHQWERKTEWEREGRKEGVKVKEKRRESRLVNTLMRWRGTRHKITSSLSPLSLRPFTPPLPVTHLLLATDYLTSPPQYNHYIDSIDTDQSTICESQMAPCSL